MSRKSLEMIIDRSILFLLSLSIGVMPLIYLPYDKFSIIPYRLDVIFKPKQIFLIITEILLLILFVIYYKLDKLDLRSQFLLIKKNKILYLLVSFYFILIISTLLSDHKKTAVFGRPFRLEGLIAYLTYFLLFFMTYIYIDNKKKLKIIIFTLLSSAAIISIYGILQYYNIDPIYKDPYIITGVYKNRAFSTLGNPVFAGSYGSMLLPLIFILYLSSEDNKKYLLIL